MVSNAKGRSLIVVALVALFIASGMILTQKQVEAQQVISTRMTLPSTGGTLRPGQKMSISWVVDLPKDLNTTWCEQEIFLVNRETGQEYRLTRELGGAVRKFTVVIPNISTRDAVFDIRYGCQQGPYLFEAPNRQTQAVFKVSSSGAQVQAITIQSLSVSEIRVGDALTLNWESSVEDVKSFEVQVSYDGGAHFRTIGKTKETSIKWKAPADALGSAAIFQVIAKKKDGSKVPSLMTEESVTLIEP